jgi:hypothetical protein
MGARCSERPGRLPTIPQRRERTVMRTHMDTIRLLTEGGLAEHIAIEGEPRHFVETLKQPHRIARSHYRLASVLHGCSTELSILEGNYLRVHSVRLRGKTRKYQFDLRYANPRPVRVRRISWTWLAVFIVLFAAAIGSTAAMLSDTPALRVPMIAAVAAVCASFVALLLLLRRTTESLEFRSEHGLATLVEVTGGLGSTRRGKQFFVELIKSINAAKLERPQPRQQFLRDEMREHRRLSELGVFSQRVYEQSKARILAQH